MRSALIVWGGWSGHDPEECAAIYRRWLHEDGFSVRVETDPEVFADPAIKDLSLIVPCTTMSVISRDAANNLAAAIESGVGMGGHHGTMGDAFHDSPIYQFVVGGQWVSHPGNIIDYTVDVVKGDDPIMQGIKTFPYTSEQYYMHVDPGVEVLATTTFSGEHAGWKANVQMPVVFKTVYGKARVFYTALGHKPAELDNPKIKTILHRGLLWATR